ncbi:MAG: ABC transporter permease [Candidatus Cloacimonetes bacterium]|nr:ABC transporter permease [Candidatus Cloacimonadota bacterium]
MISNFLKTAFRNIFRNKIPALINIFGLGLGMAVCIILFLSAQKDLSYDRFHEKTEQIYRIIQVGEWSNGEIYGNSTIPYMLAPILDNDYPEIIDHVRIKSYGRQLFKVGEKSYHERTLLAEPSLFNIFSFPLLQGNPEAVFRDDKSAVISESIAQKYFADEIALGKTINWNNQTDFTITGIVADCPENSTIQYDIILPFSLLGEQRINSWSWESSGYVLVNEDADVEALQGKIKNIIPKYNLDNKNTIRLQQLKKISLYDPLDKPETLTYVIIQLVISVFILLLACFNFINLSIARSVKRVREIGVRKVVGATRKNLIVQFLSEAVLMSFLALFIALALVELLLPEYNNLTQNQIKLNLINVQTLSQLFLFTFIVGLLAGAYPAFYLSAMKSTNALKNTIVKSSRSRFRTILVVIQFSITIVLIISTLTVYNQFRYLTGKELGYNKENVVRIRWNSEIQKNYEAMKDELLKHPGIRAISFANNSPLNVGNVNPPTWEGKQNPERVLFHFINADKEFIKLFGIELVAGRDFLKNHVQDEEVEYIVNETAVEIMQLENPIGKRFTMWDKSIEGTIVGVVKDFHFRPLTEEIGPLMISNMSWWNEYAFIKIDAVNTRETLDYLKDVYNKFSPGFSLRSAFIDEDVNNLYTDVNDFAKTISYAAVLAMIISILGLIGLTVFMTELRTKEISIRKVLGASIRTIIYLLSGDYLKNVILANLIAWPTAYYSMHKYLGNFAYRMNQNPLIYIVAGLSTLLLSLLVVIILTYKTAVGNPAKSLKYE